MTCSHVVSGSPRARSPRRPLLGPEPRTPQPFLEGIDGSEEVLAAALRRVIAENEDLDDELVALEDRASFVREQRDSIKGSLIFQLQCKREQLSELETTFRDSLCEELFQDDGIIAKLERQLAAKEEQQAAKQFALIQQCGKLSSQLQELRARSANEAYESQLRVLGALRGLGSPTLATEVKSIMEQDAANAPCSEATPTKQRSAPAYPHARRRPSGNSCTLPPATKGSCSVPPAAAKGSSGRQSIRRSAEGTASPAIPAPEALEAVCTSPVHPASRQRCGQAPSAHMRRSTMDTMPCLRSARRGVPPSTRRTPAEAQQLSQHRNGESASIMVEQNGASQGRAEAEAIDAISTALMELMEKPEVACANSDDVDLYKYAAASESSCGIQ